MKKTYVVPKIEKLDFSETSCLGWGHHTSILTSSEEEEDRPFGKKVEGGCDGIYGQDTKHIFP